MSWRTLAYIPNFDSLFDLKSYSLEQQHNDFHYCLRYLLNGLETLFETSDSYNWSFQFDKYPGKVFQRKIKFILGNVLGDTKGANLICSRFANNTFTTHIARDCDVMTINCDDPLHKCKFHKAHRHSTWIF